MKASTAVSWLACALAITLAAVFVDWSLLSRALREVVAHPRPIAVALVAYALAFVLRAEAWGAVLPVVVPRRTRVRALMAMLAVNHALPGPAGEPVRASIVTSPSLPLRTALGSVVAARVVDVAAIGLLIAVAGLAAGALPAWLRVAAPLALLLPGGALVVSRRRGVALSTRRAAVALAWAVPSWALEAAVVWAVAGAAGVHLSLAESVLVTCASVLAQVAAVLPGGIGTYEAGATSVMVVVGVAAAPALAIAAATHGLKFAFAFGAGIPALGWRWPSTAADSSLRSTPDATATVPA